MADEERLRVFVINLDRSPERLEQFLADNTMPGLEFVRVVGIEGQTLDRSDLVKRNIIAADLLYSNNSVGCSLSHLNCWQQIIKEGKTAVVCEDDAILRKDFVALHRQFGALVEQQDIVFWSYSFGLHMTYEVPGLGEFNLIGDEKHLGSAERVAEFQAATVPTALYRPRRIWGLACYTITPRGAERLLKLVLPLRNGKIDVSYRSGLWAEPVSCSFPNLSLDTDVGLIHIDQIMARVAVPPIAVHRAGDNVSTIDFGREEDRYQLPYRDAEGRIHIPLPLDSPNPSALNDTALALHNLKLFDRAIDYYDAAIGRSADLPEPYYNRANARMAIGRFEDAVADYDMAIRFKSDSADTHNNRGFALHQLGRHEEAIASYDRALALHPGHPLARINRQAALKVLASAEPAAGTRTDG
jgi:GR25 family glycosyltransferase involved in LPS biosynthesis